MKLYNVLIWAAAVASAHTAYAQTVTTEPAILTASDNSVTVTFHADGGNRALYGSNGDVYAHTGVITSQSTGISDWKYAPTWGVNSDKYKMTASGPDTWTLKIDNIRDFYGITDPSEEIRELAFVFRNSDGSVSAKSATGSDVMVHIFPSGCPRSKAADYPGGIPKMGTVENADGSVTFCLGAPGKDNVAMSASWNGYAPGANDVMNYQDYNGFRYFWTTVSGLEKGNDHIYYYIVDGAIQTGDPYAHLVLDPWNDTYISPEVYPDMPAYPSAHIGNVTVAVYNSDHSGYEWKVPDFKGAAQDDLIIYELLFRDFTGSEGRALGNGTVKSAMEKLDYLKELGVNAIELLPIMEFSGNNSWGYNPNFYMAPDKAYGTPDDYRAFIDGAHERGMAVILDIVLNQSDGLHPWYDMYTRNNTPFYNSSAPHSYSVLNDWNQDCAMVQQQWHDALAYWMTEYNVDGFRFDLVKGLGDNDSYGTAYDPATNTWGNPSENNTNRFNATRVARMKALRDKMIEIKPDVYFINENLASAEEENDMARDGETNWANINYQSCEYVMGYPSNADLNRFYAPHDSRLWGSTVSYAESHDEERVAYKAAYYGAEGVKGDIGVITKRLGSLAAQMLLTPGAHMIWQFEELGNSQTTKNDGGNDTSPKKVNWNLLKSKDHLGLHDTYAALCDIRTRYSSLFKEGVATTVDLKQWSARYVSLANDKTSLHLVVNPSVNATSTIPMPKDPVTGATVNLADGSYTLLAHGYDGAPTLSAEGVTLPAGSFAVYGGDPDSGLTDVSIGSEGCFDPQAPVTVVGLSGITLGTYPSLDGAELMPGIYIVRQGSLSVKYVVR